MTQNPSGPGSSMSGGTGSQTPFNKPVSLDGPETVINPERRGSGSAPPVLPRSGGGGSSLWTRLFPGGEAAGDGQPAAGPVGCRLGHFLIEALIGSGGMGAVFRAVDERLDRVVALKVLSPQLSRDQASIQRFVNEARAAARLDHENIARVFYVGEDQGLQFIAHEFVTGRNIRDIIRSEGPFTPQQAVNFTLQIATALRHTSAAGVVHRDIKPSNLIVNPRGRVKLVDLGLAKKVASESFGELTIAGTTLGTFDYISPEQAKDPRNVDVRSDIYSLGCTLYHMLTGEPPYPEGTVLQKLLDHQAKDVPDPSRKNPLIPPRLSAVVRRMMAPEPRDRHATPDDLILDLLPIAAEMGLRGVNPEGLVWTSQPIGTRSFVERNLTWIFAAAALVLIAVVVDRFSERTRGVHVADNGTARASLAGPGVSPSPSIGGDRPGTSPGGGSPFTTSEAPGAAKRTEAASAGSTVAPSPSGGGKLADNTPGGKLPAPLTSSPEDLFPTAESGPLKGILPIVPKEAANKSNPSFEPTPAKSKPPEPVPEISIADNGTTTPYATLEAAVTDAKDGGTIDLRYNGRRPGSEKPIRVSGKRITIRGGKGFRPVISFSPRQLPAIGFESRAIALANGGIELVDVDIEASVPATSNSDHWALVSLGGPDHLRLRGVNVTVTNPGNQQADLIDIASARDPMGDRLTARSAGPMGSPQEFEIQADNSFIRGNCGLCAVRTTEAGRLEVRQSVVAVQGPFLSNWGDDESAAESRRLSVRLEHVTCLLGEGLIKMDGGEVPRFLVPLSIDVRNNIFATNGPTPLVTLAGKTNAVDFVRLVRWDGTCNFYDRFAGYWAVASDTGGGGGAGAGGEPSRLLSFEDWKHLLGDAEVESNNGGIVWKQAWQNKPFATIRNSECELSNVNQAVSGATDKKDAGADLSALRLIAEPVAASEQALPVSHETASHESAARDPAANNPAGNDPARNDPARNDPARNDSVP